MRMKRKLDTTVEEKMENKEPFGRTKKTEEDVKNWSEIKQCGGRYEVYLRKYLLSPYA